VGRPTWAPAHSDVDRPRVDRAGDYSFDGSPHLTPAPEFALLKPDAMPDVTRPVPRRYELPGPAPRGTGDMVPRG
jgi:hypothetical protein